MIEQHEPPLQIAGNISPAPKPPKSTVPSRKRWIWVVLLIVLAAGIFLVWRKISSDNATAAAAAKAAKGPPAIPVVAAAARKGDIGVYYSGLGAVTPLATVTVRTRVDGQLMSVRYREGDTVHKGDLLVEIDDGPYQAALTQAQGNLIQGSSSACERADRPGALSGVGHPASRSRSNNWPRSRHWCTRTRES